MLGYVGRLHEGKGAVNFVRAMPLVLNKQREVNFTINGDGPQADQMRGMIAEDNLSGKVKFMGWVPHDELPVYLNQMPLVVMPSSTQVLGTIALEVMACGTPVLAKSVDGVQDIIKDGETGFLMENNSLDCIAANIVKALNRPDIQ